MNYKILIVDDEAANLRLLERLFRRRYQIICASSGAEALELLKAHDVAVIISDQRMPGMPGVEFLRRAAEMRQHTVRIILTGYTDVNALVEAINSGVVYKYVTKPWINEDLQQTVDRALQHYETIKNQYELTLHNKRLTEQLEKTRNGFIRSMGESLDLKDSSLHAHMLRTSNYAVAIGYRLGMENYELEQLAMAAFLHKIRRLGVSDHPSGAGNSQLTIEEETILNSNAERGVSILESFPEMQNIALAVRHFQERFDGGEGLPENLRAEQIPLFSRVIAVATAYDEMTAPDAPHTQSLRHDEALEKLQAAAGTRFDPNVVATFCKIKSIGQIRQALSDEIIGMRLLLPVSAPGEIDNLSLANLLQKIKTEPVLALEVLRLANSADNGEPTAQLLPAMSKLGEKNLRLLIRQYGLPAADEKTNLASARALRRAVAAQLLAAHSGIIDSDDAYSLGLVHDIGESLLLNLFPNEMIGLEKFDEKVRRARQIEIFGIDYAQISRWILESCGIPRALTEAVSTHHEALRTNKPISILMYLADKIAQTGDEDKFAVLEAVGAEVLSVMRLNRANLRAIYDRTNSIAEERINARRDIYAAA